MILKNKNLNRKEKKGFALAMTLFLLVILSTVCFGALSITTLDSKAAADAYGAARALYAAQAGLAEAKSIIVNARYGVGTDTVTSKSEKLARLPGELVDAEYTISVAPASNNTSRDIQGWKVTSVGRCGEAVRSVVAYMEMESFSKYAYFTNKDVSILNTPINFIDDDKISGYTHTNGYFTINGHPKFDSQMTSANYMSGSDFNDEYFDHQKYCYYPNGSRGSVTYDNSKFYHCANGSYSTDGPQALDDSPNFKFAGGQEAIALPKDANEAYNGARLNNTYYDYSGAVQLKFNEGGTADIYINRSGCWVKDKTVSTSTFPGVTLYFKDEVQVSGKVSGRVTLASGKKVSITGDIVYSKPNQDVLGILSKGDIMVATSSGSTNHDRYIHAIMMCLNGSFYVQNYDSSAIGSGGQLHVFGGIIQKVRGAVGTSGTRTQRDYWGHTTTVKTKTGYDKDYVYDKKLRSTPPLNFPTTGHVTMRYFVDESSLGGV